MITILLLSTELTPLNLGKNNSEQQEDWMIGFFFFQKKKSSERTFSEKARKLGRAVIISHAELSYEGLFFRKDHFPLKTEGKHSFPQWNNCVNIIIYIQKWVTCCFNANLWYFGMPAAATGLKKKRTENKREC